MDNILLSIAKGELVPGDKVAPVREMAADFKVNPNTMQKSLAKLEDMGYLFSERTSGRYVTRDIAIIARLKSSFPEQITKRYVNEMLEYGMAQEAIVDYVHRYVENIEKAERVGNDG